MSGFWSDEALKARMEKGWKGGLKDGTPCGWGSTMKATGQVRNGLPMMLARHKIRSINDAGSGDLRWAAAMDWGDVTYRAFDLVPRLECVNQIDFTKDLLPMADAVLCRYVLIHLDPPRIAQALLNFLESHEYIIASQYDTPRRYDPTNQFNETDLRPILGNPIDSLMDTTCQLALWKR